MAGNVNKVILIGRLGQDPKLAYLPSGQAASEFTLATDESFKTRDGQKEERTEWHRIKVYGKQAEAVANCLTKGRLVYVEGKLATRSWEDQQGQKRYMTEVVVSSPSHTVRFMDSKPAGEPEQRGGQHQAPAPREARRPQEERQDFSQPAYPSESGLDDVPF